MAAVDAFKPGESYSATAGSSPAVAVQIRQTQSGTGTGPCTVRVCTAGSSALMFVKFGDSSVTATSSDMALPGGVVEIFQLAAGQTHMSVISSGSSNTVYATVGVGV